MPSNLISLTEPFFLKILYLIHQPVPDSHELNKLQRELLGDLNAMEASLAKAAVSSEDWQSAKRPLVYWADEVLTQHASGWKDIALEPVIYGQRHRASNFYVEGEKCLQGGSSQVAEVYYLAIVLGFDKGDIVDAFRGLAKELPGGATDEQSARKHWARELQMKINHESPASLQSEPLEINCEPRPDRKFAQVAMAALLISAISLLITVGWWWLVGQD